MFFCPAPPRLQPGRLRVLVLRHACTLFYAHRRQKDRASGVPVTDCSFDPSAAACCEPPSSAGQWQKSAQGASTPARAPVFSVHSAAGVDFKQAPRAYRLHHNGANHSHTAECWRQRGWRYRASSVLQGAEHDASTKLDEGLIHRGTTTSVTLAIPASASTRRETCRGDASTTGTVVQDAIDLRGGATVESNVQVYRDWNATPIPSKSLVREITTDGSTKHEASPVKRWMAAERWAKVGYGKRKVSNACFLSSPRLLLCLDRGKRVTIWLHRWWIWSRHESPPFKASDEMLLENLEVPFLLPSTSFPAPTFGTVRYSAYREGNPCLEIDNLSDSKQALRCRKS